MVQKFKKLQNESLNDYILRLSIEKKEDKSITWQGIADAMHIEFNIFRSEAWVRKQVKKLLKNDFQSCDNDDPIYAKILELKKERIKLSDQKSQINANIRKIAREETIKEIALEVASQMSRDKLLSKHNYNPIVEDFPYGSEAILCISDWHYGLDFKNPWNEFSPEICKQRISILKEKTITYIKDMGVKKYIL